MRHVYIPDDRHPHELAYGGDLLKTRAGRGRDRPVSTQFRHAMHLVLRSSRAKGAWSFRRSPKKVWGIIKTFSEKHGVRVESDAIHSNHLHLKVRCASRKAYTRFIRAISAAIAMAITGASRWKPLKGKFWDRRPFSRIAVGPEKERLLDNYIRINEIESQGLSREEARFYAELEKVPGNRFMMFTARGS